MNTPLSVPNHSFLSVVSQMVLIEFGVEIGIEWIVFLDKG